MPEYHVGCGVFGIYVGTLNGSALNPTMVIRHIFMTDAKKI